jgi:hypothetical protein
MSRVGLSESIDLDEHAEVPDWCGSGLGTADMNDDVAGFA